jgi:hypothetical protein
VSAAARPAQSSRTASAALRGALLSRSAANVRVSPELGRPCSTSCAASDAALVAFLPRATTKAARLDSDRPRRAYSWSSTQLRSSRSSIGRRAALDPQQPALAGAAFLSPSAYASEAKVSSHGGSHSHSAENLGAANNAAMQVAGAVGTMKGGLWFDCVTRCCYETRRANGTPAYIRTYNQSDRI